mgnify:FL=1
MHELKKEKKAGQIAKMLTVILDTMLVLDANSTSCGLIYQPKAPEKLKQFRDGKSR